MIKCNSIDQVKRRFYLTHVKGENSLLLPLQTAARKSGFHFVGSELNRFIEGLRTAGIPQGKIQEEKVTKGKKIIQVYNFILRADRERANQAWRNDTNLERFLSHPVLRVYGPEETPPSTFLIQNRKGVRALRKLFFDLGLVNAKTGNLEQIRNAIFEDSNCPVPIFFYRKTYLYPLDREDGLRRFIEERLR